MRPAPASVERLNSLFNECYEGAPTCPGSSFDGRGSLAIVLDDTVVSAPAINGPDLASDAFVISGTFTEAEARALAGLLNS